MSREQYYRYVEEWEAEDGLGKIVNTIYEVHNLKFRVMKGTYDDSDKPLNYETWMKHHET